jgi:23S rRNA (pseudouridine1915-N3)-methyltransferase
MADRFKVVIVGRSKSKWANTAVDDYSRRLRRHGGVTETAGKVETFRGDAEHVKNTEGERIRKVVGSGVLIVLDERGDRLDSRAFAALVDRSRQQGTVVFALGGAYGHSEDTRKAADHVVRLSDLVVNHEVARVILYEQLYRAMTLLSGVPYHH